MKTKRMWRYFCDFCNKSSGRKGAMEKHEKHCTMNPNRECGICKLLGQDQPKISELVDILPKLILETDQESYQALKLDRDLDESFARLRIASGNCPACILAAVRQSKIGPEFVGGIFDFKKESNEIWDNFWKEKNMDRDEAYY